VNDGYETDLSVTLSAVFCCLLVLCVRVVCCCCLLLLLVVVPTGTALIGGQSTLFFLVGAGAFFFLLVMFGLVWAWNRHQLKKGMTTPTNTCTTNDMRDDMTNAGAIN